MAQSEKVALQDALKGSDTNGLADDIEFHCQQTAAQVWTLNFKVEMINVCAWQTEMVLNAAPPGRTPPPDSYPVQLKINYQCDFCGRAFDYVPFNAENTDVGDKKKVTAYVVENGEVSLERTFPLS